MIVVALALLAVSCGDSDDDSAAGSTTTTQASTSTTTIRPSTSTSGPTTSAADSGAVSVEDLFDGEGPREALIEGFVFIDEASTRLCGTLMESFPPQCGWAWVVIANPDGLDVEFDETQGISWTPSPVRINGLYDGDRLIVEGGSDVAPTAADTALVEALTEFAITGEGFGDIAFADEIGLGLADRIVRTVAAAELSDAGAWVIEDDEFRARSGPFSALDLLTSDATITVGPHAHCASPPVPAPEGVAGLRRVSVQPATATSCLEWSTVDLFIDTDGKIAAVTLDLFEP